MCERVAREAQVKYQHLEVRPRSQDIQIEFDVEAGAIPGLNRLP
jgi:hypothetical protein